MAGDIDLKIQVGRIEERVSFCVGRMDSLEEKMDLHAKQSREQADKIAQKFDEKFDRFADAIKKKEKEQDDDIQGNSDKLNELRRDRAWVIGIWGFVQLGFFAYVKYKFGA